MFIRFIVDVLVTVRKRKRNDFAGCARRDFQVRASRDSTQI